MILDNSAANAFRTCPRLYYENYLAEGAGLEPRPISEYGPLDLGKRVHELLEEHYDKLRFYEVSPAYVASPNIDLEAEAQEIMSAYREAYPTEDFKVIDVERGFKVELPKLCKICSKPFYECEEHDEWQHAHIYTGKIDLLIRHPNGSLSIIDHKTEKRTSRNNKPEKWAARDQATLYLWAASIVYKEPIESFIVNVLRRPGKGNPPEFPERQKLERTQHQIDIAVRDITLIADQMEQYRSRFANGEWPANRENCIGGYGQCPFYTPHTFGWSDDIRRLNYQPKTPYLDIENVKVSS